MLSNKLQRLRGSGAAAVFRAAHLANLKRKASNSLSAVQDTYLSTKEVFERHRVVFTICTSVGSLLTAWAGYSLRHLHQSKVEKRLESIEQAMKNSQDLKHEEIKKIVTSGNVSIAACIATSWTCLVIGYGLGWRGGSWFTNRKFRREQLKLMGQIKPHRWQFLKRPLIKTRNAGAAPKTTDVASSQAGSVEKISPRADTLTVSS